MRVYRWDLDKTYLETEFDTVRGVVRTALERAHHKRAVPGATALLKALARPHDGRARRIVIVSGSPEQMRRVLEKKLRLDGVSFDELSLKDNLGNLRRGRFRALRSQLAYKVPALLRGRVGLGADVTESLFGDDAEIDTVAYTLYADAVAGRVSPDQLATVLEHGGGYPDEIVAALSALANVTPSDPVERIFIRRARGREVAAYAGLGARVVPVSSWLQAGLLLYQSGEISAADVEAVRAECRLEAPETRVEVHDVLDRGLISPAAMERLVGGLGPGELVESLEHRLRAGDFELRSEPRAEMVDYVALFRRFARR